MYVRHFMYIVIFESSVHIESFSYSPFAVPTTDPSLVSMIFIQGEKGKDKAKIR